MEVLKVETNKYQEIAATIFNLGTVKDDLRLCGLWNKQFNKRDGTQFTMLCGSIGDCWINIKKNMQKEAGSKSPDYFIYLVPKAKQETASQPYTQNPVPQNNVDGIAF
jgi:hypothetical protein